LPGVRRHRLDEGSRLVEEADVEVVLVRVQLQFGAIVLDEEALRQHQYMILVQRSVALHVSPASMVGVPYSSRQAHRLNLHKNTDFSLVQEVFAARMRRIHPEGTRRPSSPCSLSGLRTT
jgi:hypothetical protein